MGVHIDIAMMSRHAEIGSLSMHHLLLRRHRRLLTSLALSWESSPTHEVEVREAWSGFRFILENAFALMSTSRVSWFSSDVLRCDSFAAYQCGGGGGGGGGWNGIHGCGCHPGCQPGWNGMNGCHGHAAISPSLPEKLLPPSIAAQKAFALISTSCDPLFGSDVLPWDSFAAYQCGGGGGGGGGGWNGIHGCGCHPGRQPGRNGKNGCQGHAAISLSLLEKLLPPSIATQKAFALMSNS